MREREEKKRRKMIEKKGNKGRIELGREQTARKEIGKEGEEKRGRGKGKEEEKMIKN